MIELEKFLAGYSWSSHGRHLRRTEKAVVDTLVARTIFRLGLYLSTVNLQGNIVPDDADK